MTDAAGAAEAENEPPKKKSKALLFGALGAVLLGGGSFYAVYSGLLPLGALLGEKHDSAHTSTGFQSHDKGEDAHGGDVNMGAIAFVPLEPLIVSLGPNARSRHLKVVLQIEVNSGTQMLITELVPRIKDTLNTFLRAVDEHEFEEPNAMMRLRAQMLRRVQLVTPENAVRDVLIQEFVLD